jgi:hypothetical protein
MLAPLLAAFSLSLAPPAPTWADIPQDPPRVAWQRSLDDALALQKQTGLPLLIAVNMDGEVFNERFAGTTYKSRAFVESTKGYVCVIASPNRHTESDYDALGNRIECPRFGGCTCSEHINIEPELFRRYFNGNRNAPRHVGVGTDGEILYDRFLDRSMQTAIDAIAKHRGDAEPAHLKPTDDVAEMFRRRDAMARSLLEQRYRKADASGRRELLQRAAKADNDPVDLLRMGLRDPDGDLVGLAAIALGQVGGSNALIDIEDALARVEDQQIRAQLVEQLQKLGRTDKAAARMAAHFSREAEQAPQPWRNEWRSGDLLQGREGIERELDRIEGAIGKNPKDDTLRFELATAQAAFATMLMQEGGSGIEFWLTDAANNVGKVSAEELRAEARALTAIVAWYRSDAELAQRAATEALTETTSARRPDAWLAANFFDVLLQLSAQSAYARAQQDEQASLAGEIARAHTALALLEDRDAGQQRGVLAGIGLLEFAGLRAEARGHLERLVQRFPASLDVHNRWRNRMLIDWGAERMRHRYAKYASDADDRATAEWYAGYAALVAGDRHTQDERRIEADNAYTDAIERFARSAAANADYADSSNHYAVFALAGRALVRHGRGQSKAAVDDLVRAAELRPETLDLDDSLQRKPRGIAIRVHGELQKAGKAELAARLQPLLP